MTSFHYKKLITKNKPLWLLASLTTLLILALTIIVIPRSQPSVKVQTSVKVSSVAANIPQSDNGVSYDAYYLPMDISSDTIQSSLSLYKSKNVQSIYVSLSERDIVNPAKITKIIEIGHQLGLRVYANPYIGGTFSGDEGQSAEFYLAKHPESEQITRLGIKGHVPSVNDPSYVDYLKGQLKELAKYNFDGIEFDEPQAGTFTNIVRSPGIKADYYPYDQFSQALFKKTYGYDMPLYENPDTLQFRRDSMHAFVKNLVDYTKIIRPDWLSMLVLLPQFNDGDIAGTNNWADYASLKNLDVLLIDPYWYPDTGGDWDWFVSNLNAFSTATKNTSVKTGVWARGFGLTNSYGDIGKTLDFAKDYVSWRAVWVTDNWKNADAIAVWDQIAHSYQ